MSAMSDIFCKECGRILMRKPDEDGLCDDCKDADFCIFCGFSPCQCDFIDEEYPEDYPGGVDLDMFMWTNGS